MKLYLKLFLSSESTIYICTLDNSEESTEIYWIYKKTILTILITIAFQAQFPVYSRSIES